MEKLLSSVMDIGEEMLLSGAEVHRVEESIRRMCLSLGAERTDVFIITSSMVVTVIILPRPVVLYLPAPIMKSFTALISFAAEFPVVK